MNDNQRYNMTEKIKHDKQQLIFNSDMNLEKNKNPLAVDIISLANKTVFCPFCLGKHDLAKFVVNSKHGFSRRYAKCPECNTLMLFQTLVQMLKWTPKEFAKFICDYPPRIFWSKISNFENWKHRLNALNMSYDFWESYKSFRGTSYSDGEE